MKKRHAALGMLVLGFQLGVAQGQGPSVSSGDPFAHASEERSVAYPPSGHIVEKREYWIDDDKIGERLFYENARMAEESRLNHGQLEGVRRQFYESGKVFSESPYAKGQLDGSVRFYKENGELLGESKMVAGTGTLRHFSKASPATITDEIPYKNGEIDGTMLELGRFFDAIGIGCSLTQFSHNMMEGWSITFSEGGKLLESSYMHEGQLYGVCRQFDETGAARKGFPKYYLNNKEVTESAFRDAAKTDQVLNKTLNDDGRIWAQKLIQMPK